MIETIVLDNGNEYEIIENRELDGITYTLFVNVDDDDDILFRKIIVKDGEEYYTGLDGDDEFIKVLNLYAK